MGVDSHHPLYSDSLPDWQQLRDTYKGERAVKVRARFYLPATSGMEQDGIERTDTKGWKAYMAYRARAVFPELVKEAVKAMIGVMHHKPPTIELPAALEPLREKCNRRNESLEMLLRRINEEQLVMGRLGLMADAINAPGFVLPYLAIYRAEDCINWGDNLEVGASNDLLRMVALNESKNERIGDGFEWQWKNQYRVLVLGDITATDEEFNPATATYRFGVFNDGRTTFSNEGLIEPSIRGRKLNKLPFVFINSQDISPEPDEPPLLGLSNIALTIYRGEADYRQSLFMQGQDTLVVKNGEEDKEYRTGAGAVIVVQDPGDAKYIGVDSSGLPEQRTALENDYQRGQAKAGELINETSRERESGNALRIRVAARTATLNQIALTGAFGLQEILRTIAEWVGANPEEVVVTPNLDFVDDQITGKEVVDIMTAKGLGAPLSLVSIHRHLQDRGLTEMTWEEELQAIEDEKELELVPPSSTNPNGPEDNPADRNTRTSEGNGNAGTGT